jgi:hypothetical protein
MTPWANRARLSRFSAGKDNEEPFRSLASARLGVASGQMESKQFGQQRGDLVPSAGRAHGVAIQINGLEFHRRTRPEERPMLRCRRWTRSPRSRSAAAPRPFNLDSRKTTRAPGDQRIDVGRFDLKACAAAKCSAKAMASSAALESDAHHITAGNLPPGGARRIEPPVVEPSKGG